MKAFLKSELWHLIINPNALSDKCLNYTEPIKDILIRESIRFESHIVISSGICKTTIEKLCKEGNCHFMVLGGDGTLNEVVTAIFNSGIDTTKVYIIPFPLGTGNDWCRTHCYPKDALDTAHRLYDAHFIRHDVGTVEVLRNDKTAAVRHFVNIAGFGFDAAVIQQTAGQKPKFLASAKYLINLLKVLFSYKPAQMSIFSPDFSVSDKIFTIAVGICEYNGNGMRQVPMADPTDGLFDVVVIKEIAPSKVIKNVKKLYSGTHIGQLSEIEVYKTNALVISATPYGKCEVEGEMLPEGDYRVTMRPNSINLLSFK